MIMVQKIKTETYSFVVQHQVVTQTEIVVVTSGGPNQAESNMLKKALELGLDVRDWQMRKTD